MIACYNLDWISHFLASENEGTINFELSVDYKQGSKTQFACHVYKTYDIPHYGRLYLNG